MTTRQFLSPMKMCAALLAITCFLTFGQGAVSSVLAADPPTPPPGDPPTPPPADPPVPPPGDPNAWETWPKKSEGAATAGEAGGEKASSGISAGTWGWIAGGAAGAILIGVAVAGGGGGNGGSPPVCNQ
jgi:hypothetical protein